MSAIRPSVVCRRVVCERMARAEPQGSGIRTSFTVLWLEEPACCMRQEVPMEGYETTFEPGDEIILVDVLAGIEGEPAVIERVVMIAPLPHQSERPLYVVRLTSRGVMHTPTSEEALLSPTS